MQASGNAHLHLCIEPGLKVPNAFWRFNDGVTNSLRVAVPFFRQGETEARQRLRKPEANRVPWRHSFARIYNDFWLVFLPILLLILISKSW